MAGRPKTRAKREAEVRSGKRFDRAARIEILKRAEEIGSRDAAAEAGIAMGTLRTWRKRAADAPEPASVLPGEPAAEGEQSGTPAERLRTAAEKARQASSRALDQADSLLARGLASEARNASVVSSVHAERAQELESSARTQEEHELALTEGRGQQVLDLVARMFAAVDLTVPPEVAQAVLRGEEVAAEVAARAREQVRGPIREQERARLLTELEAERRALPALPAGETDDEDEEPVDAELVEEVELAPDDDDLPPWDSLPQEWQQRYGAPGQRHLGRYEYQQTVRREEIARRQPRASAPGRFDPARFTHPGLSGGP